MRTGTWYRILSVGLLLLCALGGGMPTLGASLQLWSRQFVPPNDVTTEWTSMRNRAAGETVHALIQLEGSLTRDWLSRLEARGITLDSRIPEYGFLATIPIALNPSDFSNLNIRYVGEIQPDDKIQPRVRNGEFGDWSQYTENRRIFAVTFFKDTTPDITGLMSQYGGELGPFIRSTYTWILAINPDNIYDLALRDDVKWIEEVPPPQTAVNDIARLRTHAEQVQAAPYNLMGDSVIVCVYDAGLVDNTHNDLAPRVTWGEGGSVQTHATHVAGSVASSGALNGGLYRGMAPHTQIISYLYEACNPYCLYNSPQDIEANYGAALNTYGAMICTNSIGSNTAYNGYDCAWEGDYEITSQLLDEIVTGSLGTPFSVFYAAGNERGSGRCGTTYNTMGVPAGAKDIVTVGATDDNDQISSFTSWGPTDDGRLKPDVSAPGVNIMSTEPGNTYGEMSGTSMATPVTAGCTALIFQKFHQMFSQNYRPLPATVKALLCVSANDLGNPGPDYQFGHGRVNVQNAIDYMMQYGFREGVIAQAETLNIPIQVTTGISRLEVVLAWDDPAAVPLSPVTLVNDLDLQLLSPTSTVYLPLTLDPQNPSNPAVAARNPRDNVEHAVVANPAAGAWDIRVIAYNIPGPITTQSFALASNIALVSGIGTISGVISDSSTGAPLAGWVEIEGGPQTAQANSQGQYSFYLPGDSTYTLIAHMYGYMLKEATVYLPASGTVTLNFQLRGAPSGIVNGHVYNGFGTPLENATVEVLNTTITPAQTNAQGAYTLTIPAGDTYTLRATYQALQEEHTVYIYPDSTIIVDFILIDPLNQPSGPDNYGYYAIDSHDIENAPTYNWVEIDPDSGGQGTVVYLIDDQTVQIPLPFAFTYYGDSYDTLSICSNGWVACGYTTVTDYSNSTIPDVDGPPAMIAPFWEDLLPASPTHPPTEEGVIAYWYDQTNSRFVIEYDHVQQYLPVTAIETFEIILHDPNAYPTITGDGEIVFQYRVVGDPTESTTGIENFEQTDGLCLLFNNAYDQHIWHLEPGLAIRFTTGVVPGVGSVAGSVTLHPTIDPTQVTITAGNRTGHPLANGTYQIDSVWAGTYTVTAALTSYENGAVSGVHVIADSLTGNVNFDMYRMDPPTNLHFSRQDSVVTLWWHSPWALALEASQYRSVNATTNSRQILTNTREAPVLTSDNSHRSNNSSSPELSLQSFNLYRNSQMIQSAITDTITTNVLIASGIYNYYVRAIYTGGQSDTSNHVIVDYQLGVGENPATMLPKDFFLSENYPNPFNPTTRIRFGLPEPAHVKLSVFNILGQQVAILLDDNQTAGYHQLVWDAGNLASGLYFVMMEANNRVWIQKGLLMK
jgi:hypothetical protein